MVLSVSPTSLTESSSFRYGMKLISPLPPPPPTPPPPPAQVTWQICPWPLKTDKVTSDARDSTGGYWRFVGGGGWCECVGQLSFWCCFCPHQTVTDLLVPIYFTLAGHIELSTSYWRNLRSERLCYSSSCSPLILDKNWRNPWNIFGRLSYSSHLILCVIFVCKMAQDADN